MSSWDIQEHIDGLTLAFLTFWMFIKVKGFHLNGLTLLKMQVRKYA